MASAVGISLPEMLHGEDARSWFRRFEVCTAANEWDKGKKLKRVPMLLKGRAWALMEAETDTYAHLKAVLLEQLSPDPDEIDSGLEMNWHAGNSERTLRVSMNCTRP